MIRAKNLLNGEKNGKQCGKKLNIVAKDVEKIRKNKKKITKFKK